MLISECWVEGKGLSCRSFLVFLFPVGWEIAASGGKPFPTSVGCCDGRVVVAGAGRLWLGSTRERRNKRSWCWSGRCCCLHIIQAQVWKQLLISSRVSKHQSALRVDPPSVALAAGVKQTFASNCHIFSSAPCFRAYTCSDFFTFLIFCISGLLPSVISPDMDLWFQLKTFWK